MQSTTQLLWAGFDYNSTQSITDKLAKFACDRSLIPHISLWVQHSRHSLHEWVVVHWHLFTVWFTESWHTFLEWFKQPRMRFRVSMRSSRPSSWYQRLTDIIALILTFCITFSVVLFLLGLIGFNPIGIGAGRSYVLASVFFADLKLRIRLIIVTNRYSGSGFPVIHVRRLHTGRWPLCRFDIDGHAWHLNARWSRDCNYNCNNRNPDRVGSRRRTVVSDLRSAMQLRWCSAGRYELRGKGF